MKPLLITGAPGCGKTTKYVESLARETKGIVYVFEPVQEIVKRKLAGLDKVKKHKIPEVLNKEVITSVLFEQGDIINTNISYINYAEGFSLKFNPSPEDVIVIDEAHSIFYMEFRTFAVNSLSKIFDAFKNNKLIFITATPKILQNRLENLKIEYEHIHFEQRLKRNNINIHLIPVKSSQYLTKERLLNYDIICIDSIKTLKKIEYSGLKDEFLYLYSNYSEQNHFLFNKEIKFTDNKRWLGTNVIGQGIDKNTSLIGNKGNVLFDGNSSKQIPDETKHYYNDNIRDEEEKVKRQIQYFHLLCYCLAERIIQTDRFRFDLDTLNMDVLLDIEIEQEDIFKNIVTEYIQSVYTSSEVTFISGDGLYAGEFGNFTKEIFDSCVEHYDPLHTFNRHDSQRRFKDLLNFWCSTIKGGKRIKKLGNYKNTLTYIKSIYEIYNGIDNDYVFFDRISELRRRTFIFQQGLIKYMPYLIKNDIKSKAEEYLKIKKWEIGKKPKSLNDQLYTDLDYLGETFLEMILSHYDIRYNIEDEEYKRGGSPIQLLPKYLRSLIIAQDIDISGAHIVALIKKIMGNDYKVDKDTISKIYSYNGRKDEVLNYMTSYSKIKELNLTNIEDIEKEMGSERAVCKQAMLWGINRLDKYKSPKDYKFIKDTLAAVIPEFKDIDLSNRGELGYSNGIKYENIWLGEYNTYRGVIFRIADGLCQIYGNVSILNDIKEDIISTHNIPMSIEPIDKYYVLGLNKLNDYINEEYNTYKDIEITDDMLLQSMRDIMKTMEVFRKYCRKNKTKGKATGNARGKSVGLADGKAVKEKRYLCTKDLECGGKQYTKGDVYTFGKDFTKHISKYNRRFFLKVE